MHLNLLCNFSYLHCINSYHWFTESYYKEQHKLVVCQYKIIPAINIVNYYTMSNKCTRKAEMKEMITWASYTVALCALQAAERKVKNYFLFPGADIRFTDVNVRRPNVCCHKLTEKLFNSMSRQWCHVG